MIPQSTCTGTLVKQTRQTESLLCGRMSENATIITKRHRHGVALCCLVRFKILKTTLSSGFHVNFTIDQTVHTLPSTHTTQTFRKLSSTHGNRSPPRQQNLSTLSSHHNHNLFSDQTVKLYHDDRLLSSPSSCFMLLMCP